MSQLISVPAETFAGEKRAATVPDVVTKLMRLGFSVAIQSGAGDAASITADAYRAAGAAVMPEAASIWSTADIIFSRSARQVPTRRR